MQSPNVKPSVVVCLHGIMANARAMRTLERHIQKQTGYRAVSLTYHPFRQSLAQVAESAAQQIRELNPTQGPVFAVACSLGSVVLRHIMALPAHGNICWAGCVLIAPPSRGSMVARRIHRIPLLGCLVGLFLGRGGRELGPASADGSGWALPPQPCGVIAGSKAVTLLNPVGWVSNLFGIISRPNDGTIALEETRLDSMTDFCSVHAGWTPLAVLVHAGHTKIQNHPRVLEATVNFILHQRFDLP